MNRDRGIVGVDSYAKELRIDLLDFLSQRIVAKGRAAWLDLCCGSGRALIAAVANLQTAGRADRVEVTGIDLIDMFQPIPAEITCLQLRAMPLQDFQPQQTYDLITCVHGLHYIGDKLRAIQRSISWLADDGLFAANFDAGGIRTSAGKSLAPTVGKLLKAAGVTYRSRLKLIECRGHREFSIPFEYLGADDRAGPNYTHQPVVDSVYRPKAV